MKSYVRLWGACTIGIVALMVCGVVHGKQVKKDIETLNAVSYDNDYITFNGRINPRGRQIRYFFEYGTHQKMLGTTEKDTLPSKARAYYYESFDHPFSVAGTCKETAHSSSGGIKNGYITFHLNTKCFDRNHMPYVGMMTLLIWRNVGPLHPDSVLLGGGDPDFRDARVSFNLRAKDVRTGRSQMVFWTQNQKNIEIGSQEGWRRSNWAFTGNPITPYLAQEGWQTVQFTLFTDANRWTYGGNNWVWQGESAERYEFHPLRRSLLHMNVNFMLVFINVDPDHPPEGEIALDEFLLEYANESLLAPDNGGRLLMAAGEKDADKLTDGWRFGEGHVWQSAVQDHPLQILYGFDKPVTVQVLQIHQNPEWPAEEIEVLASNDGERFDSIFSGVLPRPEPGKENYGFVLKKGLNVKTKYLKFLVKSGYKKEHWGLGEIEAFGEGGEIQTEDRDYYVSQSIEAPADDGMYSYRLVIESETGKRAYGDLRRFSILPVRAVRNIQ